MRLHPIAPGQAPSLDDDEAAPPGGLPDGDQCEREMDELRRRLKRAGDALWAERERALLVVLQARDAGGKDGTIKSIFGGLNPRTTRVASFGPPSDEELAHDFLWRVHAAVPPRGMVGVFNRSHYEDVLAARVREYVPAKVWSRRYEQINHFEELLAENGVTLLKLFLHVSREEQRRRMLRRLASPRKRWKFDPGDLKDRELWDEYTEAYRDAISRCGTERAPWYVVPADDKPARNLLVGRLVVETLEGMHPRYPEPGYDVDAFRKRLEAEGRKGGKEGKDQDGD
jgi:PPK2 family polyphosphate:nucleotide phosphotransferase